MTAKKRERRVRVKTNFMEGIHFQMRFNFHKCYLILPTILQLLATNRSIFARLGSNQGQVSVLRRFRRIGDWILEDVDLK